MTQNYKLSDLKNLQSIKTTTIKKNFVNGEVGIEQEELLANVTLLPCFTKRIHKSHDLTLNHVNVLAVDLVIIYKKKMCF